MTVYEKEWRIHSTDVDLFRHLKLSSLFTELQEAAVAHTESLGITKEKTLEQGLLWIVAQQTAVITRLPVYEEKTILRTWPGKTMHLFFPRYWQLLDENGAPLIEVSAYWALMDQTTRKIVFPEEHNIRIDGTESDTQIPLPRRIRSENVANETIFTVPYSYLDLNGHMNNARYFDLAVDCLPENQRCRNIRRITIEYISEARLGDAITLRYGNTEEGDRFYLFGETNRPVFRLFFQY